MSRTILLCLLCFVLIGCRKDKNDYLLKSEALLQKGKINKAIRYLEKYIDNDSSKPYENPKVRLKLAKLYLKHDPTNKALIRLLEEAGDQEIYEAYALLSLLYRTGEIVSIDPGKSFQFIQKASGSGDHNHLFTLAQYLFDGYGISKNTEMATEYFLEAAENGSVQASGYLCEIYTLEKHKKQSSEIASKHCKIAIIQELPRAIHAVNLYSINKDEKSLLALLKNASNQWVPSQLALVKKVLENNSPKYRKEIFELFKLNIESTRAEFNADVNELKALYYRFWQQYPNEANKELAIQYLNEAREAEQAIAMTDWAILNLNENQELARKQLELAAQKREPTAHAKLGELYLYETSGFSRDESAALKHLEAACNAKITTSCYQLGILLSESYEIPRNVKTALKHLSFAAFKKHEDALNRFLNLSRLNPDLVDPSTLEKLHKLVPELQSNNSEIITPVKRPWQELLDRSKNTEDLVQKSKLLELSKKSLLNEFIEGFELNYQLHKIEYESFQLQIQSNPFHAFTQMKRCWDLLSISKATKKLKDFFKFDGIVVNWSDHLKRLERLERNLVPHYSLQSMRIYDESYKFWNLNFDFLDGYYSALIDYRRAHQNVSGPSLDRLEAKLREQRAEIALRQASIDHEMERFQACMKWINKVKKDQHPIHHLVEGRMLVSLKPELRNDVLAWQLLMDSAKKSPHIDSQHSAPLPGGKAESLLLLSKMIASQRSPKKYWGKKHEYMFLKVASHFQPRYTDSLIKLGKQIDPRLALKAEKLAERWIEYNAK